LGKLQFARSEEKTNTEKFVSAVEARSKIFIQATVCAAGLDVILTYRTSIYVRRSKNFKNIIMTTFFLFDKFDRWAIFIIVKGGGGGGGRGEVGARAV
jgi:hypothetical protein